MEPHEHCWRRDMRTGPPESRPTASGWSSRWKALKTECPYDLGRGILTRLTASTLIPFPVWTPDGKYVTFDAGGLSALNLYWMPADASGAAERLTTSENPQWPGSWSPDGQVFAFTELDPETGYDIGVRVQGDRKAHPFLQTPSNEYAPMFSPDGHWVAYGSD
jgi:Tol biopolymer transport system component